MTDQRRLAAILVADVVGYSKLVGSDESGTLSRLRTLRSEIIEPVIGTHGGRLFKAMGDGFLVEFASAVRAVTAAQAIQQANAGGALQLRIGLHVGDVVVQGDDLMGDGVNIAARIESMADPGGVAVSRAVHEQVRDRLALAFTDKGEVSLKNIARPVHVFALGGKVPTTAPTLALPDKPSIAVLPFQNMSGDPEQEYFVDGLVEDIITALSRFKSLFVIARNSSFTYKGNAVDIKQVGQELGVRYVLEGSVRKAASKVRITGQLIDAQTGAHLWADRFDGPLEQIFEVQDQVAASVVGAIVPTLDRAEVERSKRKPVDNLDAYDLFLRARDKAKDATKESMDEALRLSYRSIELSPTFAAPHGMAALVYAIRKTQGWVTDKAKEEAEVRRLAVRVSQIGQDDASALCFVGHAMAWVCRDLETAAAMIDSGLSINPNFATGWAERGMVSLSLGEHEAAVDQLNRALRLSPIDIRRWFAEMILAYVRVMLGDYVEAYSLASKALLHRPNNLTLLLACSASQALSGDVVGARERIATIKELRPGLTLASLPQLFVFRRQQDLHRVIEGLRLAGLPE